MDQLTATALILVIALGFHALFALYFYRRYLLGEDSEEGSPERFDDVDSLVTRPEGSVNDEPKGRSEIPCPTCGTPNDPSFQFCCHCVADLSDGTATRDSVGNHSSS